MSETKASFEDIWAEAARQFQEICGESLQRGDVKSFDDVRRKIENVNKQQVGVGDDKKENWDKIKTVGLESLKYMKILLGAANQGAAFFPIPTAATNIACSALSFVFDMPERIHEYNEAVDQVFTKVSSALSQFQIYESIGDVDYKLVRQIQLVMASIVKICAHVVKYRQGCRTNRIKKQLQSMIKNNEPLKAEMSEFQRVMQAQRDLEGTVTLSVLVETRAGVQALKDDNDRTRTLIKIRDTLQVPTTVLLDTRTTITCTSIASKCLSGTGSWIWSNNAFISWTQGTSKDTEHTASNVLIVSGPPSSGKTMTTAQIIKHLEGEKDRIYVAHYFFLPASSKKGEDDSRHPVHSALRYMAFQIARVDATVRKALGKACDTSSSSSILSQSLSSKLEDLWLEFKIGTPGLGATYYFVFDGIENLDEKEHEMLLTFISNPNLAKDSAGRVRILVSGTDKIFENNRAIENALQIEVEKYNESDMRLFIEDRLNKQNLLRHAKAGSVQQKARDSVIAKLPQKAGSSYSQLQFALEEIIRLLSSRTSFDNLDKFLDDPINSHETAIEALQRSLSLKEISELNELLKWVHFSRERMTVARLEAVMFLCSGTESIGLLDDIITSKYLAVLKIDDSQNDPFVDGQDGALEYLQSKTEDKIHHSKDHPTISMTININNVDQEIVGHFLWDLAHKAIRDQFRFNFDIASSTSHTSQSTIAVDEFEAHHTIVVRALKYLSDEPRNETKAIGDYLFSWLPYHLSQLSQLDYDQKGRLNPDEQHEIGQYLYQLFRDQEALKRHRESIELLIWSKEEIADVQKWLRDSAVVRGLPKKWREEVQRATTPVKGYFKPFVEMILEGWLRDSKRQNPQNVWGYRTWIREIMESETTGASKVDWEDVSAWCQNFLQLPNSELDSLWWNRIGVLAAEEEISSELLIPFFKRALEKENASWVCNNNLALEYFNIGLILEAISEMELALEKAELKNSRPTPDEEDIMSMRLGLGEFNLGIEKTQQALDQYLLVSNSKDADWAERGQVAYVKTGLSSDNQKGTKDMLRNILSREGSMVRMLKEIARDTAHDFMISKLFDVAKDDQVLLKGIVAAIEKATMPEEDKVTESSYKDDSFAMDESRGVLLYHRGMIVAYKQYLEITGSVEEAPKFWHQCREQLSAIGGFVASTTRTNATNALAKYYFHSRKMYEGPLEHLEELSKLADEDSRIEGGDSVGYLAVLYALSNDKEKAKSHLLRRIKVALQILSDNDPENDGWGYLALFKSLAHYRDLSNSAAALIFMRQPDLTTDALDFKVDDINDENEVDKDDILDTLNGLSKEILQIVKAKVPKSSQQSRRIEVAKEYIDTLTNKDSPTATTTALNLIANRVSSLQEMYKSNAESTFSQYPGWYCDGPESFGTVCDKVTQSGHDHDLYHCIYCTDTDFCPDCFKQLRKGPAQSKKCSPAHEWIKIPPPGSDIYRGLRAKNVRIPVIKPDNGDERVLEVCYPEDVEAKELTVEEWKASLAKEWGISSED